MGHYYETANYDYGNYMTAKAHDTLDGAIEYANMHDINMIYEVGGNWMEFGRCAICGEFVDVCELNGEEICESCVAMGYEHGF